MNNSPLLILDYDTSELIGFYLEIIKKYKRDIVQKYKRVVQEFHKNINILQYHFNITVNNQNLINFNKEIYYNENELTMKELLCYRKTGYVWNGMRHSEIIPMTTTLSPFKRSYNKFLNKNYRRARYVCSCFTYECNSCYLKVDDYLQNRYRVCNKNGRLLVALYFKNTRASFIYDYKKLLSEIKNKQISKLIKNFEEKMRDNTTYTTHNAYNFLIDDYYNPNMDIYIEE